MKNLFYAFLSLLLLSCSGKNIDKKSSITLFNDCIFNLTNGEILSEPNIAAQKLYENYFNNSEIQIPLFKHIKHVGYDIFVGIPVRTSVDDISKTVLEKHNRSLSNFISEKNSCYNQYLLNGSYIVEMAIRIDDKSLFYIAAITSNKILADSLLSFNELSGRITKGRQ